MHQREFSSIRLKNYGSYKTLDFPIREGKHLICGPNGGGKSTPMEALKACIYKSSRSKDPSHNYAGDASVEVDLNVGEDSYTIERHWNTSDKRKSPVLYKNGEEQKIRLSREVENNIQSIVGMGHDLFVNTVVVMQGLPINFCSLGATVRKTIAEEMFGFTVWDAWRKKSQSVLKDQKQEKNKIEMEFAEKRDQMIGLNSKIETVKQMEKQSNAEFEKEIEGIKKELSGIKKNIEIYNTEYSNLTSKESEMEIRNQIQILEQSITNFKVKSNDLQVIVEQKICPTCRRDYPHSMIADAENQLKMLTSKLEKIKPLLEKYNNQYKKIVDLKYQIDYYKKVESSTIAQINMKEQSRNLSKQDVDLDGLNKQLEELNSAVNGVKESLSDASKCLDQLLYIDGLLVPSSKFRSHILSTRMSYINNIISTITPFLFMDVEFQLILDQSDGIDIYIKRDNKRVDYKDLSGGEKRRIDLITIFSFQKFMQEASGISSNLLVFDEIFEGLDSEGVESVLNCVDTLFPNASSIYVITHKENIKSMFDSIIYVSKENGVSCFKYS